jgi:hypothetical protein
VCARPEAPWLPPHNISHRKWPLLRILSRLAMSLSRLSGFDVAQASAVAKKAHKEGTTLIQAGGPEGLGYFTAEEFAAWVRPEDMTRPEAPKSGTWYNGVKPGFAS